MKKQYLDYAGLKRVLKRLLPGARKIWHGTADEWEALSETERDKYDQAEVIDGSSPKWLLLRLTPEKWPINQKIVFDENTFGYRFYRAPGSAANTKGQQTDRALVPMDDVTNYAIIQSGGSFQRVGDKSWHDINTYSMSGFTYFYLWPISGMLGLFFYASAANIFNGIDTWCIVSKNTGN